MAKATKYPAASISVGRTGKTGKGSKGKQLSQKLQINAKLDPELYGTALLASGQAQAAAGNFRQAAIALQSALDFHIELYGATHPLVIDCRLSLAEALRRTAKLKAAREMIEGAVQLARSGTGVSSIQLGLVLNELAALELHFNDLKAAYPAAKESLSLLEAAEDPRRTLPMDTLARINYARGEYAAAEKIYAVMLPIDAATFLGTEHPRYVAHLHNQAAVLQAGDDTAGAIKAFKKVAIAIKKLYGNSYADLPTVYSNLGRLEQNRNKRTAAKQHFEAARKLTEKLLGKEHPFYGYDLANLGRLALESKDAKQAAKYLQDALTIYRNAYDRPHSYTATALTLLAYAQLDLGQSAQASENAENAVAYWEELAKQCADRIGDAGACDRGFAKIVLDVAQAACQANGSKAGVVLCQEWDTLENKLQKGDIRRRLLAMLAKRGLIQKYSRPANVGGGMTEERPSGAP